MKKFEEEVQNLLNLYKLKNLSAAEITANNLINKHPQNVWLYNILGLIFMEQKRFDEAINSFEKGIKVDANYAALYDNLGTIYKKKKDYSKSETYYKKSIELNNKIPEPKNNLGNLYRLLNNNNKAIDCYVAAIKTKTNFFPGHYNLGITYKSIGKFKESKWHLNETIKINENIYAAHRNLSEITKYSVNDPHLNLLKKIYNDKKNKNTNKKELAFALGKAYEDVKDFKKAFEFYNDANNLHRKTIDFSIKDEIDEFKEIKKTFNKKLYKTFNKSGNRDNTPIFILGMPRSGTTLVEQILSSHSDVYGGDELNFLPDILKESFTTSDNKISFSKFKKLNKIELEKIGEKYIKNLKALSPVSKKISDKLPINFKWIGLIKLILPNSKIIHCNRNSKDVCLSIFKNYFVSDKLKYAYNLKELTEFYKLYSNLMKHWEKTLPKFIYNIKYENIIHNPDREFKRLLKACDLGWDANCLKFYENKRAVNTASDTQVRKKIYKTSLHSWKKYKKFINKFFQKLPN